MSSVVIAGDVSGSVTLQAPSAAGTTTLTLPATSGTVLTTTSPKVGNVLQVVQGTDAVATTVSSSTLTDTGLTATITPSSTSSKILIIISQPSSVQRNANGGIRLTSALLRGASVISTITGALGGQAGTGNGGTTVFVGTVNYSYLDSPATSSSTTYKVQSAIQFAEGGYSATLSPNSEISTITLLEIAG